LAEFIPVLFIIITMVFFMVRFAPGGPFDAEKQVSEQALRQIERQYNLDAPLWKQYVDYLGGLLQGDLGPSLKRPNRSVAEWIALKFPVSLELGLYGLIVALGVGLPAGIIAAWKPNTWRDYLSMTIALVGICVPNFVLGPLLVLVFAIHLELLPVALWEQPSDKILPAITLGMIFAAYIARLSRASMIEVLSQDFIRTARAKGVGERALLIRHALRGSLQPVVAFLGPASAGIVTGSFVVENIFGIPGLGTEFINAALNRDYTMILGATLVFATLIMTLNLVVDVVQAWLDPRLRHG
jgi:oligopeptide transport system permease protein